MTHPAVQRARELAAAETPPYGEWIATARTLLPELAEAYETLEADLAETTKREEACRYIMGERYVMVAKANEERDRLVALNTRLTAALRNVLIEAAWPSRSTARDEARALLEETEKN